MTRHVGLFVAVAATGMFAAVPVFAQGSGGLAIDHPALFPFTMSGAHPDGVTEQTATRVGVASGGVGIEGDAWHPSLYPFLMGGERGDVTPVATPAPVAAVDSELTVWHPSLFPFRMAGQ